MSIWAQAVLEAGDAVARPIEREMLFSRRITFDRRGAVSPAFEIDGVNLRDFDLAAWRAYYGGMDALNGPSGAALAHAFDWSGVKRVTDVGGA